jgi:hypothetical protein
MADQIADEIQRVGQEKFAAQQQYNQNNNQNNNQQNNN